MHAGWTLVTPPRPAALAVVQVGGLAADTLRRLGLPDQPVGSLKLRDVLGIDQGLVAVVSPSLVQLTPHGGPEVVRALLAQLTMRGIPEAPRPDLRRLFPEARSLLEAQMLAALSTAASAEAVDLLAAQPMLWNAAGHRGADRLPSQAPTARDREWRRLIDPPLVVAWGPANIGKSTLLNRLAGRDVAIVADEPGTTRDHVGAAVEFDRLVVNYLDTPGVRVDGDAIEACAADLARSMLARADLILLMGDRDHPPPPLPNHPDPGPTDHIPAARPLALRVHLREDLGVGLWPHDVRVSAANGTGLAELARMVRALLIPGRVDTTTPWVFW